MLKNKLFSNFILNTYLTKNFNLSNLHVNLMFNNSLNKNFIEVNKKKVEEKDLTALFSECELRVGRVEEVKDMENSESIYYLKVNMGDRLRDVGTGLRKTLPHDEFKGKNVIVFCNLKTKKLGDFVSDGMILCASNEDKTYFELLRPSESINIL